MSLLSLFLRFSIRFCNSSNNVVLFVFHLITTGLELQTDLNQFHMRRNREMGNMTPTPSNVGEGAKLCFLPVKFENFPNFPVITGSLLPVPVHKAWPLSGPLKMHPTTFRFTPMPLNYVKGILLSHIWTKNICLIWIYYSHHKCRGNRQLSIYNHLSLMRLIL